MVLHNLTKSPDIVVKKRPRLEDTIYTAKLFLKNRLAFVGFVITMIYFAIAVVDEVYPRWLGVSNLNSMANWVPALSSNVPTAPTLSHGWMYIFGTTQFLVPIFPAMLAALKFDIGYSLLIVAIGALFGLAVGTIAGYFGKIFDEVLMRVTDIFFSVPFIVLAFAISYALGRSLNTVIIALIIIWWPIYARLTRGLALSTRSMKYVEAATASGSSGMRNVAVHVIPNVLSPVFVQISLDLGSIVQIFATLYFLNVIQGSQLLPELGNMISRGQTYLPQGIWWPVVIPGIFLLIFTVSINLMGDGLRDVLDPKLRR